MRNLIQIIVLIFCSTLFGQDYYELVLSREKKTNLKNVVLITSTLRDSTGITDYISNIQIYDKNGISKLEFDLNKRGDTLEKITSIFSTKYSVLQVHSYSNSKNDTAYFYYNKKNFKKKEVWKWGDNDEVNTYDYFYDKSNKLIKKEMYFGVNKYLDTLIYKDDRITTVLTFNEVLERQDSISYLYNKKNHLVKVLKFNSVNELKETQIFNTNDKGKFIKILKEFKASDWSKDKNKNIIQNEYYLNGELKTKKIEVYINGKIKSKSEFSYSELGVLEKIIEFDLMNNCKTEFEIKLYKK